jgi:pimeloyl-ACP methyl ester carboxylesterase
MNAPRLVAIATLAVLPALLVGCAPGTVTSTPTGEKVAARYERYYEQELTWKDCGSGMQCATAIAPMDWSAPDPDEDISLALVRHHAGGSREGSLFVNPGGPGASGFDFVHDSLDFAVSKDLQSRFDIVGWDPRGVGRSSAVDCYDDAQLDKALFPVETAPVESGAYACWSSSTPRARCRTST